MNVPADAMVGSTTDAVAAGYIAGPWQEQTMQRRARVVGLEKRTGAVGNRDQNVPGATEATMARQGRRWLVGAAAGLCAALLATACAPQEATSSRSKADVDPEVTAALKKEGLVRFHDGQYMENSLQAYLMKEIVTELGGEAETVQSGPAEAAAAMCKADDLVSMDWWRWQFEDGWQKYVVKQKCIVDAGTTDYKGEEGWYVPTYVIKGDAKRGIKPACPELPDWKALNKCVDVFKTSRTTPKGQYLTGAESWAPAYGDQDRIDNLKLDYKMAFAGSEAALFAELSKAYERGEPWLGLMWRPNYLTQKYDLTRVEFPPYSDKCWKTTHACQWPETVIYRTASAGLESKHPTVWKLLQNYELDDKQLSSMQSLVVNDGMSIEDAAKNWVKENREVWTAWI
ncbi:glycine betaine ABC transporter substrate-binding protein [Streptomyces sp. SP18BB07]|uniref:glycine betaine ABC transporter substrate-binding protein n=1 Tax=Streptomyces sp. SP18BB07 TaxID=3002522 RepID=UPI002E79F292|nr:glycine betaine ABC transporter substrate-binding protein [Streptomyces sp. SP18BB07]MEE1757677.1 glycine betaine ABC transporter substrate-binding protein [Streptomyces sp. SP18BB07]